MSAAPRVRTHNLRTTSATGCRSSLYWLQCRGCGQRWPYDADREPIEAEPCGTPLEPADLCARDGHVRGPLVEQVPEGAALLCERCGVEAVWSGDTVVPVGEAG